MKRPPTQHMEIGWNCAFHQINSFPKIKTKGNDSKSSSWMKIAAAKWRNFSYWKYGFEHSEEKLTHRHQQNGTFHLNGIDYDSSIRFKGRLNIIPWKIDFYTPSIVIDAFRLPTEVLLEHSALIIDWQLISSFIRTFNSRGQRRASCYQSVSVIMLSISSTTSHLTNWFWTRAVFLSVYFSGRM